MPTGIASPSAVGASPAGTTYVPFDEPRSTTVHVPSTARTSWAWRRDTPVSPSRAISGYTLAAAGWSARSAPTSPASGIVDDVGGGHGCSASSPVRSYHAGSTSTTTTQPVGVAGGRPAPDDGAGLLGRRRRLPGGEVVAAALAEQRRRPRSASRSAGSRPVAPGVVGTGGRARRGRRRRRRCAASGRRGAGPPELGAARVAPLGVLRLVAVGAGARVTVVGSRRMRVVFVERASSAISSDLATSLAQAHRAGVGVDDVDHLRQQPRRRLVARLLGQLGRLAEQRRGLVVAPAGPWPPGPAG